MNRHEQQGTEDRGALAADLANRFAFHPADTESKVTAHEQVRAEAYAFAAALADLVPPGRERALAFTAIEEAMMWGNAGIARQYATGTEQADAPARRPMTAGELGLVQDVDPHPVGDAGTQNPASLVETDDMPAAPQPGPAEPAAPPRNVSEPAEAPHAPSLPPEYADDDVLDDEGSLAVVMVPTTTGGTIAMTLDNLPDRPHPQARWDVNAEQWEVDTPGGSAAQPDPAVADPDTPSSP